MGHRRWPHRLMVGATHRESNAAMERADLDRASQETGSARAGRRAANDSISVVHDPELVIDADLRPQSRHERLDRRNALDVRAEKLPHRARRGGRQGRAERQWYVSY